MTDVLRGAVPLPPDPEVWAVRRARLAPPPRPWTPTRLTPEPEPEPEPPPRVRRRKETPQPVETPPPPPPPPPAVDAPCDVCGVTVTAAYIAAPGRARHGHHPAQEP